MKITQEEIINIAIDILKEGYTVDKERGMPLANLLNEIIKK